MIVSMKCKDRTSNVARLLASPKLKAQLRSGPSSRIWPRSYRRAHLPKLILTIVSIQSSVLQSLTLHYLAQCDTCNAIWIVMAIARPRQKSILNLPSNKNSDSSLSTKNHWIPNIIRRTSKHSANEKSLSNNTRVTQHNNKNISLMLKVRILWLIKVQVLSIKRLWYTIAQMSAALLKILKLHIYNSVRLLTRLDFDLRRTRRTLHLGVD